MADTRLLENRFAGPPLGALFQQRAFFELHDTAGDGRFFEWAIDGRVVACVHFTPAGDGLWRSPLRGTFGGFAAEPGLHGDVLFAFHDAVLERLRALGARRVELLPAPMAHDPVAFSNQAYLLHARGWQTTHCDLNHTLAVDERPFETLLSYGNLKRLRKCRREGVVGRVLPDDALPAVFDTIAANRASKGHAMSMTLAQLAEMQARLPGVMRLYGAHAGDELAAAALCLRLSPAVLYVFYWGDRPGHAQLSPVVAVAEAIHADAQAHGVTLLDAGTSTVNHEPNHGLIQFKRALGFTESLKLRLARTL